MIFGIGTDIVAVARMGDLYRKHPERSVEKILAPDERDDCRKSADPARFMAKRFAAKEAFLKALGTGLRDGISWLDMEIISNHLGKPEFVITGKAAEICTSRRLNPPFLSLSHDGGFAIATVVLEAS